MPASLTYNGANQALVTAGKADGGTLLYAVTDSAVSEIPDEGWQESVPAMKNAGSYNVWYKVQGDANHNDCIPTDESGTNRMISVTIDRKKVAVSGIKAMDKVFDNTNAAVLDTSEVVFKGKVGADDKTPPDVTLFTADLPVGTDAGTYYVWYIVVGDENHFDLDPVCVTVGIQAEPGQAEETEKTEEPESEPSTPAETEPPAPGAAHYEIYAAYARTGQFRLVETVQSAGQFAFGKLNGKKLKTGKAVKVYVVAYRGVVPIGTTITGYVAGPKNRCTNVKRLRVRKKTFRLAPGRRAKIKVNAVRVNRQKKHLGARLCPKLRFISTNSGVASVNQKGVITAVGTGSCDILIYAQNGRGTRVAVAVG